MGFCCRVLSVAAHWFAAFSLIAPMNVQAQEPVIALDTMEQTNLFLSYSPIESRINRLLVLNSTQNTAAIGPLFQRLGIGLGASYAVPPNQISRQLKQRGSVWITSSSVLEREFADFVFSGTDSPLVWRIVSGNELRSVALQRRGIVLLSGETPLQVTGKNTDLIIVNGELSDSIGTLVHPGQTPRKDVITKLEKFGLSAQRFTLANGNWHLNLQEPGNAVLLGSNSFKSTGLDALFTMFGGLRAYELHEDASLEQIRLERTTPSDQPAAEETVVVAVVPPVPTPRPEQTQVFQEQPTISARGEPEAESQNAAEVARSNTFELPEPFRSQVEAAGPECVIFFRWLARYFAEYDINPRDGIGFQEQYGRYRKERDNRSAAHPFLKLFSADKSRQLPTVATDLFEATSTPKRYAKARGCFSKMIPNSFDGSVAGDYSQLHQIAEIYQRGRSHLAKEIKEQVAQISGAYDWIRNLEARLNNASEPITSEDVQQFKAQAQNVVDLIWPSERVLIEALLARSDKRARATEALVARGAESNEDTSAATVSEEDQARLAEWRARARRCQDQMTHPDDPDRSEEFAGRADSEMGDISEELIADCTILAKLELDPAQAPFLKGRALLFSGREEEAQNELIRAAELGNAPAYAYLSDFVEEPEASLELARISFDLGFLLAQDLVARLEAHIAEIENARLAEADRAAELEVERKSAIYACDNAAAHPDDPDRPAEVVPIDDEAVDADKVISLCGRAIEREPELARLRFQLARGLMMFEEFTEDAERQLNIGAEFGHALSSFALFGLSEDEGEARRHLEEAARRGYEPAKLVIDRIPIAPAENSLRLEMVFRDVGRVLALEEGFQWADGIEYYETGHCETLVKIWRNDKLPELIEEMFYTIYPDRGDFQAWFWSGPRMRAREWRKHILIPWCERFTEAYGGGCIDQQLISYATHQFEALDEPRKVAIAIANSADARADPSYFDRTVGNLTDYVGYFYARKLGIISQFDPAAFNDAYMFTDETDEYVRDVVRELIASDKLIVITQAFDNSVLCKYD